MSNNVCHNSSCDAEVKVTAAGNNDCSCDCGCSCDSATAQLERTIALYPALIFDMDGTVINSEIRHHDAWNHMLDEFGFERLSSDILYGFASLPGIVITRRICEQYQSSTPEKADPEAMNTRKNELYENIYIKQADPFAYFVKLIKEAHARGQRIAIATSSRQHEARYLMDKAGLTPYLDSIISGDMVENGKPAPDIYQLAASTLNMPYTNCLVFEDSVLGMKGAAAARMDAIKVFDGHFDCNEPVRGE